MSDNSIDTAFNSINKTLEIAKLQRRIKELEEENSRLRVGVVSLANLLSRHDIRLTEHVEFLVNDSRAALEETP